LITDKSFKMKNISKLLFLSFILACTFWACTKDEVKDYYTGGTNPVLSASATALSLSYANAAQTAVTFSWTNPNYQFTTGVSSQNVTYVVEIDTTGANFTNPNRQTISISQDLSLSISIGTFNDYLLNQLQLKPGMSHNLDVRVTATLINSSVPLYSNVLKLTTTPYAIPPKVNPPTTGKLYLVGDATAGGWNNPVPVPAQQFTQVSTTLYEITVPLIGGFQYLFLPLNGDWGHKFACAKTANQSADGGDFGYDFTDNFPGPAASGTYKISVDFQRGKYTVTKQ
jgi:starch-binding outer membrane protein SusE/F